MPDSLYLDVVALTVGLACVVILFLFRQFAALVLPHVDVRVASEQPPEAFAAAFAEVEEALRPLGFTPFCWLHFKYGGLTRSVSNKTQVFHHCDGHTHALVQAPIDFTRPDRLVIGFGCDLDDGGALATFRRTPFEAFFATPLHRRVNVDSDDLHEVLAAHRKALLDARVAAVPLAPTAETMAQRSKEGFARHMNDLVRSGTTWRDRAGHMRLRVGAIFRAIGFALRQRAAPPAFAEVSPAAQFAMLPLFEQHRDNAPAAGMQLALLLLTTVLFMLAAALLFDASFALVLAFALLLHEGGHYLAMRMFGYRNVQMVLLPLLGGITTGVESDPHGTRRALVSLMGPLPGIVLGWALILLAPPHLFEDFLRAGIILLVLNYLNLLPFPPLDGGHFVQSLLPRRWLGTEVWLMGALVVAGLLVAWQLQWWIVILLFAFQLNGLRQQWRDARLLRALMPALDPRTAGNDTGQLDAMLLAAVAHDAPAANMLQRLTRVVRLRTRLLLRPPGHAARLLLVAIYVTAFALPLLFPQVRWLLGQLLTIF